jgi:hypothetical protein
VSLLDRLSFRRPVPEKLGLDLVNVLLDAWAFGGRLTAHAQIGLPTMGLSGRTTEQRKFDHEYIAIVLSWIGLAVDMINADLRFGDGEASERYAKAVKTVYGTVVDRFHSASGGETKAYLHEAFTRYAPPDELVTADFVLIHYQLQAFADHLVRDGLSFETEVAKVWLGTQCIRVQPKVDAIVEAYSPLFTSYCLSSSKAH